MTYCKNIKQKWYFWLNVLFLNELIENERQFIKKPNKRVIKLIKVFWLIH